MKSEPLIVSLLMLATQVGMATDNRHELDNLERSFWLHASLAAQGHRGYWRPDAPPSPTPSEQEIQEAARLLTGTYSANRLYLVYHREIPLPDVEQVFRWWRQHVPEHVTLVPTLVLRMYDQPQTHVFTPDELRRLAEHFQRTVNATEFAVYDVYDNRDQAESLKLLAEQYPKGLVRVGIQPGEEIESPFVAVVQDTWSGFCHGKTNADWMDRGFGAETLRNWVATRNRQAHPVAWDLIVVAWDYAATERGGHPGYDDAARNMPLPADRNRLAAQEILRSSRVGALAGFSSDLLILQANSANPAHDGSRDSFYETLKRGEAYAGYYRVPFQEVVDIYRGLANGKAPHIP